MTLPRHERIFGLGDGAHTVRALGDRADALVRATLGHVRSAPGPAARALDVSESATGCLRLEEAGEPAFEHAEPGFVGRALCERTLFHAIDLCRSGPLFHGGAVQRGDRSLLFPGASGSGKTTLVAALVSARAGYVTDELVLVAPGGRVEGFPRALHVRRGSRPALPALDALITAGDQRVLETAEGWLVAPDALGSLADSSTPLGAIVFPRYVSGAATQLAPMSPAAVTLGLVELLVNARHLPGHGFSTVAAFARSAPGFTLEYGELSGALATLGPLAW